MRNAKEEFLKFIKFKQLKAVNFTLNTVRHNLPVKYTDAQYDEFLRKLDVEYDPNDIYAIDGYIWFEDEDIWGERARYGEWVLCYRPEIPLYLQYFEKV